MIRHLQRDRIDARWWDQRLLECRNKLWYARYQVLDLASPGWEALVDDQSGAIMPLTWRRKYGVRYLFQPFALQQLGIFSPAPIDPAQQERMLRAVPPAFRLVDIAGNGEAPPPVIPGWASTPSANLIVRHDAASVDHRVGYSQGHLRNLRRGTEAEFHAIGTDPFMALFLGTTALRHGPFDKAGLRALPRMIQLSMDLGEGRIEGMTVDGQLVAAIWWVVWQDRVLLMKSANSDKGRGEHAMFHLVDRCIGTLPPGGMLDLAGSNDPGTRRFYEGFGARPSTYFRLRRNTLPRWIRKLKP